MGELAKQEVQSPVVADAATSMLGMIERAARDESVDIEKMERLFAMRERLIQQQAETEFNAAMSRAQASMRAIVTDMQNGQTRSRYASYAAIDHALRDTYTSEGFALTFNTEPSEQERSIKVICYVSHQSGFTRTYHVDMPADGLGAKGNAVMTRTHATGSALSYGQRYLVRLIFNIATTDDDGNYASNPDQYADWLTKISEIKNDDEYQKVRQEAIDQLGQGKPTSVPTSVKRALNNKHRTLS